MDSSLPACSTEPQDLTSSTEPGVLTSSTESGVLTSNTEPGGLTSSTESGVLTSSTESGVLTSRTEPSSQAILITGGWEQDQVEAFFPETLSVCSLPSLPFPNRMASQDGPVMCGGDNQQFAQSCYTFGVEGDWTKSHQLVTERVLHSSWKTDQGILLMGGKDSENTTELGNDCSESDILFLILI